MRRTLPSRRATRLARAVLTRNLQVRPGEKVMIEGWSHTLPWAVALARETRRLKAFPLVLHEDEDAFWDSVDAREDETLGAAPAHEWAALGKTDVYIHMWGAGDRLRLNSLPAARVGKIFGFNEAWYKAAARAGVRGSRLEIGRPFPNLAKAYGVRESKWMDQLVEGTMVDPDTMLAAGKPILKALERGRRIRIRDDHGTDLTLGLAHRPAVLRVGRITKEDMARPFGLLNGLPAGSVRVALEETVGEGSFVANRASYFETGKATGGEFQFRKGRLIRHRFADGARFFEPGFRAGGTGRDRPGVLSIGLNPKLHDTPQVEDLEAGAVMVSVGGNRFFPGGKNKSPFFGFAVNAGVRVEIDGRTLRLPL